MGRGQPCRGAPEPLSWTRGFLKATGHLWWCVRRLKRVEEGPAMLGGATDDGPFFAFFSFFLFSFILFMKAAGTNMRSIVESMYRFVLF